MRSFSGFPRVLIPRVTFKYLPGTRDGLQEQIKSLPSQPKILRPFGAVLTAFVRWRHGDNIPRFLNRETGTSPRFWQPATTFTFSELIIRGWAGSLPRASALPEPR